MLENLEQQQCQIRYLDTKQQDVLLVDVIIAILVGSLDLIIPVLVLDLEMVMLVMVGILALNLLVDVIMPFLEPDLA